MVAVGWNFVVVVVGSEERREGTFIAGLRSGFTLSGAAFL
jgi:hypothetical protein